VKCKFCHFATFPGLKDQVPAYLDALDAEMRLCGGKAVDTVFVGGGTPTFLSGEQIISLFRSVKQNLQVDENAEISMECNPDDGEPAKLEAMLQEGVNRLSFGLQAAQDSHLQSLGRTHDFATFLKSYSAARQAGFENINVDLMYGLPGQTLSQWRETLDQILAIAPEHISGYALDLDEPSALSFQRTETDEDLQADMYELLSKELTRAGYSHYEISNFARPDFQCRHNLKYWRNEPCLGVGVAAAGFDGKTRHKNHDRMAAYLDSVQRGIRPVSEETALSAKDQSGENLMLGLRLKEGARISAETEKYYGKVLEKYRDLGLLALSPDSGRAALTLNGWMVSNRIFVDILN